MLVVEINGTEKPKGMQQCITLNKVPLEHVTRFKYLGSSRVLEARLRKTVKIDDMQFGFSPGKGTTDAIFIIRQVQEKLLGKQKELWMAFVDLEKASDRVPREVLWWALRHVEVEEWMINVIKSLYEGVTTAVKRNGEESESFEVKVGVNSVLAYSVKCMTC